MNRHWVLVKDTQHTFAYIDEYPVGQPRIDWSDWKAGRKQGDQAIHVTTETSQRYPAILTDAVPNKFSLPIFSTTLVGKLNEIGVKNLELHPLSIKIHDAGDVKHDYVICNVLGLISAMDRERSDWTGDRNDASTVVDIDTLVLSEDTIEKYNKRLGSDQALKMFRLEEFPRILIVDNDVKELFQELKVEGWKCIEPEEWV